MHLDVVRDVTNMASVLWTSWQFGIPLKTESTPHALFSPKEFYSIISAFFCFGELPGTDYVEGLS